MSQTPMYPGAAPGAPAANAQATAPYGFTGGQAPHMADPSFLHLGSPQYQYQGKPAEVEQPKEETSEHTCGGETAESTTSQEHPEVATADAGPQGYAGGQPAMGPDAYKYLGSPQYQYQYQPNGYAPEPQAAPMYGAPQAPAAGVPYGAPQPVMPSGMPEGSMPYGAPQAQAYMGAPQGQAYAGAPVPPQNGYYATAPGAAYADPRMYQQYAPQQPGTPIPPQNGYYTAPPEAGYAAAPHMFQQYATQQNFVDPQYQENQYGQQILEMCNDLMQGKADPAKIANFLTSTGTHFWKGAIIGAGITFLATNSGVRSAISDTIKSIFGGKNPTGE